MNTSRLEAFSDGVIAILITIMVLELKVPHAGDAAALEALVPVLLGYVLSFVLVGIYWTNHHHLLHATTRITGAILWANLHLLFWLSLVPFVTAWMGEHHSAVAPNAAYGIVLLLAGVAYVILQRTILRSEGPASPLAAAVGQDRKGPISALVCAAAIAVAFISPWLADALYVANAAMWLVPDRRIERALGVAE